MLIQTLHLSEAFPASKEECTLVSSKTKPSMGKYTLLVIVVQLYKISQKDPKLGIIDYIISCEVSTEAICLAVRAYYKRGIKRAVVISNKRKELSKFEE